METVAFVLFLTFITSNAFGFSARAQTDFVKENSKRFLSRPSGTHIFVSPTNGSDTDNDGQSTASSFQTLAKALSVGQNYKYQDVYIELQKGYYDLDKTLYVKNLNSSNKLTIRAYRGQKVHVTGGRRIDSSFFKPVTDQHILSRIPVNARSHVRVAKLRDLNITDYGTIRKFGTGIGRIAPLEIFFNGEPLRLAQYPNKGYINIVAVINGPNTNTFRYDSDRPKTWKDEHEIWTYGFWKYGWVDKAIKAETVNAVSKTVILTEKIDIGLGHWNDTSNLNLHWSDQGGYFRFFNVLSELDEPGEYYLDRSNGNLYVWVPNGNGHIGHDDVVYASMINDCIALVRGYANIVFQDFTLEDCRKHGVVGTDITNLTINYMEVRNTGAYSILINGYESRGVSITSSVIHDGSGAIYLSGGNRTTLEPSRHVVSENEIYQYTRDGVNFYRAVNVDGVGFEVHNNHIHTGGYGAVV